MSIILHGCVVTPPYNDQFKSRDLVVAVSALLMIFAKLTYTHLQVIIDLSCRCEPVGEPGLRTQEQHRQNK